MGAVTMLVSNLFFGQGPWTPWQMFAMGCIGGLAGSLFSRRGRRPRKGMLCLFGFLAAVVLYGAVMNTASVLLWSHSLQWELIAGRLRGGSAHGFAPRGEHSPAPVPAGRPGARQAGPGCGRSMDGAEGERGMGHGNKNRPPAGHAVGGLFVWKGRYPRKKPTEGSSDEDHQEKSTRVRRSSRQTAVQPFVFGLYHGFVEG